MLDLAPICRTNTVHILLADDHQNVRSQVRLRLGREQDLQVIAEAANSVQAVECAMALNPQIALIDPMMQDGLGFEAVRWIAGHLPETAIVVLTAVADTALQIELRKLGVSRILNKGIASVELVGILRDAGKANSSSTMVRSPSFSI